MPRAADARTRSVIMWSSELQCLGWLVGEEYQNLVCKALTPTMEELQVKLKKLNHL